eukprot:11471391-Karenia_brevis.AAC.1
MASSCTIEASRSICPVDSNSAEGAYQEGLAVGFVTSLGLMEISVLRFLYSASCIPSICMPSPPQLGLL